MVFLLFQLSSGPSGAPALIATINVSGSYTPIIAVSGSYVPTITVSGSTT